jgi:CHAD domain-containing protein
MHYWTLGATAALALVLLNLPPSTADRLKLGVSALFLPLFGLSSSGEALANQASYSLLTRSTLIREVERLRRENNQLKLAAAEAAEAAAVAHETTAAAKEAKAADMLTKAKAARAAAGTEQENDVALHLIRKRAKRLRYTAAATAAGRVSEQAKVIQTLLGDHQDSVVSREHLVREEQAAHAAGEDTFTYGLLYQQEAALAERSRQQLDDALGKLAEAVRKASR